MIHLNAASREGLRGIVLFCDQCDISKDFSDLSGFIRAANSGSASSTEQTVMRTEEVKCPASGDYPLGSLQKAGRLGRWSVRMPVLTEFLEFLAQEVCPSTREQ